MLTTTAEGLLDDGGWVFRPDERGRMAVPVSRVVGGSLRWVQKSVAYRKSLDRPLVRAVPGVERENRPGEAGVLRTAVPSTGPLSRLCSLPSGLEACVDRAVPILQRRGLF